MAVSLCQVLAQAVASAGSQQSTALENARQLLSYTLIHPAVTVEERRALTHWLRALEERLAEHRRHPPPPPPTHNTLIHGTHTHTHPREGQSWHLLKIFCSSSSLCRSAPWHKS